MPLLEINRNPNQRQLRQFAFLSLVALPLAGWSCGGSPLVIVILVAVGLLLAFLSLIAPRSLTPVFVTCSFLTAPIGIVMGEIILLLVYLSVFVPLGLTLRLIRGSSMQKPRTTESESWWLQRQQSQKASSYYRQS